MPGWIRRVLGHVPAGLTLLLLAALGYWGMRNDWRLPRWGKDEGAKEEAASVEVVPDPDPPTPPDPDCPPELTRLVRFPSAESVRKAGIQVAPARERALAHYVTAYAMLDYVPTRYVELYSPVAGRVWSVEKELGQPVVKGDVLAVIDAAEVGRAKADLLQSLSQVSYNKQVLQRLQTARTSLPDRSILEAQATLRDARIRLLNDQQKLLNLGLALPLKEVEDLPDEQASRQLRLLGLPDKIRGRVDADTLTANLLPLTAPFDGRLVVHPHAAPGQVVGAGKEREPLFVLADVRELHIDLEVHAEDVPYLRVGQTVSFIPAHEGGTPATGTLEHISPEVNEKTRNVTAHAGVENPDGKLRPHTFGTGRVLVRKADGTVVPAAALQSEGRAGFKLSAESLAALEREGVPQAILSRLGALKDQDFPSKDLFLGQLAQVLGDEEPRYRAAVLNHVAGRWWFVFVRTAEDTFQARPVQIGLRENDMVEVRGVRSGEEVATTGSHVLKSALFKDRIAGGD
jgi:cobalt-zinc-cadmium efflux system membrane fusion protein